MQKLPVLLFAVILALTSCKKDSITPNSAPNPYYFFSNGKDSAAAYLPDVFTPDSDDWNDDFKPFVYNIDKFDFSIYSRTEIIFNTNDFRHGWDGTYKGMYCMPGVYGFAITGVDHWGNTFSFKGNVLLIRNY